MTADHMVLNTIQFLLEVNDSKMPPLKIEVGNVLHAGIVARAR